MSLVHEKYFWTESICGNYKIVAVAFGFGPTVAAENFSFINEIILTPWKGSASDDLSKSNKYLLNFGVSEYSSKADFKIWIDCLMWLRESLPAEILNYNLILAEKFFPLRTTLKSVLKNYWEISPLINTKNLSNPIIESELKEISLLVSFGGIETPFSTERIETTIPQIILELLTETVNSLKHIISITICLPPTLNHLFADKFNSSSIKIISPNKDEYIELLKQASLVVLQPGLYGPFEAFFLNKKILFTPPFSYTQIMQEREYLKNNLVRQSKAGKFITDKIILPSNNIEVEEAKVFSQLDSIFENYYWEIKDRVKADLDIETQLQNLTQTSSFTARSNEYINAVLNSNTFKLKDYLNEQNLFANL